MSKVPARVTKSVHSFQICRNTTCTVQKMKFFVKDFFSKCGQIHRELRIWSDLLKKSLMQNFIFCAVLGLDQTLPKLNFVKSSNSGFNLSFPNLKFPKVMFSQVIQSSSSGLEYSLPKLYFNRSCNLGQVTS